MNPLEIRAARWLTEQGFKVFRVGWPDFLVTKDGLTLGVEIKSNSDWLRQRQIMMHEVLFHSGIPTIVIRESDMTRHIKFKRTILTCLIRVLREMKGKVFIESKGAKRERFALSELDGPPA